MCLHLYKFWGKSKRKALLHNINISFIWNDTVIETVDNSLLLDTDISLNNSPYVYSNKLTKLYNNMSSETRFYQPQLMKTNTTLFSLPLIPSFRSSRIIINSYDRSRVNLKQSRRYNSLENRGRFQHAAVICQSLKAFAHRLEALADIEFRWGFRWKTREQTVCVERRVVFVSVCRYTKRNFHYMFFSYFLSKH